MSTRCRGLAEARRWLDAARARSFYAPAATSPVGPGPTLDAARAEWLASKRLELCSPQAVKNLQWLSGPWVLRWGTRPVSSITRADVRAYLGERAGDPNGRKARGPVTLENERRSLRAFFAWCVAEELTPRNPCAAIKAIKCPRRRPRVLEEAEVAALLEACRGSAVAQITARRQGGGVARWTQKRPAPPYLAPVVLVATETGLRSRTLLGLSWAHVDLEAGWLRIPAELMKAGEDHEMPLSPRALDALAEWRAAQVEREGTPAVRPEAPVWGLAPGASVKRAFRSAARRAGLEVKFHDLRRTFISLARRRGVPLDVVMALSDHRDLRTVLRHYRGVSREELLAAVGRDTQADTAEQRGAQVDLGAASTAIPRA